MDNNVIAQVLAVVLFLFFCFVTYMNTKTWRATHVTFLFLTFASTFGFIVYSALVLKTRKEWQKREQTSTKLLEDTVKKRDTLLYGALTASKTPETRGIADIRHEINKTVMDRGNVWRNVRFVSAQPGTKEPALDATPVTVNLNTRPADEIAGAKVEPNHVGQGTILFAFKDISPEPTDPHYVYIGEFQATAVTDETITLVSTMPFSDFDLGLIEGAQPWVLYERMPVDSQQVFSEAGMPIEQILRVQDFVNPAQHPEVLANYKRDGEPPLETDPPESKFAKVRFLKEYTMDVDATEARTPLSAGTDQFDRSGRALDPRLRRGAKVTFKPGDEAEIILDGYTDENGMVIEKGASQLATDGVLEITKPVYRRPLKDYEYEFRHIWARENQIRAAERVVATELATVQAEEKLAIQNKAARDAEKVKVLADLAKVKVEIVKTKEYADSVEASYRKYRAELSRLYRENADLHAQILAANDAIAKDIDSRNATPTATEVK